MTKEEFDRWFTNLKADRSSDKPPCVMCSYHGEGYCPAANWMELEFNANKCRDTLWQTLEEDTDGLN